MNYIGIDPGKKGGIAYLMDGRLLLADPYRPDWLDWMFRTHYVDLVTVEKVHSMPAQGVASTFTFGLGFGEILGICRAYGFTEENENLLLVPPQTWKKHYGLIGKSKEDSVKVAMGRWPYCDFLPSRRAKKPSDGIAEAALIGQYGAEIKMKNKKEN